MRNKIKMATNTTTWIGTIVSAAETVWAAVVVWKNPNETTVSTAKKPSNNALDLDTVNW